ncbi:hypothetical protein BJ944DRAFT_244648 [Cunninghamella echinulata]|nr:hypothetical protein BJ944DRAFT_244648 [Cunninghamella echinulata]
MPNNSNQNSLQNSFSIPYVPDVLPEIQNKTSDSNQQYIISIILKLVTNTVNDLQEVHMVRQTLGRRISSMDTRMDPFSFILSNNSVLTSISASFSIPDSVSLTLNQRHSVQISRKNTRVAIVNDLRDKTGNFTWKGINSIVLEGMIHVVNNKGERRSVSYSNGIDNWAAKAMLQKIFNNMTYHRDKRKPKNEVSTTPSAITVSKIRRSRGIRGSRNSRNRSGSNGGN